MRTKITPLILLMLVMTLDSMAQTADIISEKEKSRIAKVKEVAGLVDSKIFVFRATRANPTGYKPVDLTTNPGYVKFSPNLIVSEMPYFGRVYSVSYGDGDLNFWGKPDVFTLGKKSKNYAIKARVKDPDDCYMINLTVNFEGSSSLSISSNNRAMIHYNGDICATER